MKSKTYLPLVLLVSVFLLTARAADVREGLVSFWPLDSLSADLATTPDVVSGNHMNAVNFFDTSAVVNGKRGKAFSFDGDTSTRYLFLRARMVPTPACPSPGQPVIPFCSGSRARGPARLIAGCFAKARAW